LGQVFWLARESLRGFRRSGGSALASTWSAALACGLLFLFLCAAQGWLSWSSGERDRQGWVEVFLTDSVSSDVVARRAREISGSSEVRVVDKARAKERFVERFGPEMLQALDSNPLPVSVRLRLSGTPEDAVRIVAGLQAIPGVESVDSPHGELEDLDRFQAWVGRTGLLAALVLFGVVFGVIRNSVQLSLKSRDRLIDNMRILGASRWQIEAPFALEGLLQGVLGGLLASVIPWVVLWTARAVLPLPLALDSAWGLRAGAVTMAFAALAGGGGGWWTVRRAIR
jgi:cell division transport system permease protein